MPSRTDRAHGFAVRPASPDEYERVSQLCVAAYAEFQPHLPAELWTAYAEDLSDVAGRAQLGVILVVTADRLIAGTASYFPPGAASAAWLSPQASLIRAVAVDVSFRRRGLARLLTLECAHRARCDRAEAIELMTNELMQPAVALYESLGFSRRLTLPAGHGDFYAYRLNLRRGPQGHFRRGGSG